jgi:glucoamylase
MSMKKTYTVAFVLAGAALGANAQSCSIPDPQKQDCGHVGTNQQQCEASGCCWQPAAGANGTKLPNPYAFKKPSVAKGKDEEALVGDTPWCFFKSGGAPSCPLNYTSTGAPFSPSQVATMRGFFLNNINIDGSGAVVASPDTNTPGGSYYYHWERDAALSMQALLMTAGSLSDVQPLMDSYVAWVKNVQSQPDPHGQSVLAEPKYLIPSGQVFPGAWCRPQNDGPGLRSHTLIDYATALQADAERGVVHEGGTTPAQLWAYIQIDLDWQAANWQANGCDLWEEIESTDFFWNRCVRA